MEIICDKSCESLPVRWRYGDVQKGKKMTWGEESSEWKRTDGVWYPAHYVKIAFIGREMRPTKEYDLRVSNLRANTAAKIPAAVFTLSDLPFPDGYGGWDNRSKPPGSLIRANGVVRERRIGEPWKDINSGPIPFPKIAEATSRVEKEEYSTLVSEYSEKRRKVDEASMKARTETEQRTAIDNMTRLESAYAGRFLALAENHKGDSVALDALINVVTNEFTPKESEQAADILIRDHVRNEELRALYTELGSLHLVLSQAGEKVLRAGLASAPTHSAQAAACHCLAQHLKYKAQVLRKLMGPHPDAFWLLLASASGSARAQGRPAGSSGIDRVGGRGNLYAACRTVRRRDRPQRTRGRKCTQRNLQASRAGSRQACAPQIDAPDVDGRPMKLSDYRGKAVVLIFTMSDSHDSKYEIERGLVEKMKNRPLAVLSVSYDFEKETLKRAIQDGLVTWPCWWDRPDGPIHRGWRVNEIPCVYVIDAAGIIRARNLEGRALEDAVEQVVKECEARQSRAR